MIKLISDILKTIENNGFEAYIVGGYVRDSILKIESSDVDIITNALPKDLLGIFNSGTISKELYGSFRLRSDKYNFDITTYRKESHYKNRRPTKVSYINNLIEDLNRRDFTINSLCMNSNGEIIDLLDGRKDIENKVIKIIGNPRLKLKEDPLRILRAVRFATILDFSLDKELIKYIKKNRKLVRKLSYERKKEELDRILTSSNALKGLNILKQLDLLDSLEIKYNNIVYVKDLGGMWSQIEYSPKYNFSKQEKNNIKTIKYLTECGKITNKELYEYGLYYMTVAGAIMNVDNIQINKMFSNLPITNIHDIDITTKEILESLNIKPSQIIKDIYQDLVDKILDREIKNEKSELISYIKRKW